VLDETLRAIAQSRFDKITDIRYTDIVRVMRVWLWYNAGMQAVYWFSEGAHQLPQTSGSPHQM